MRTFVSVDAACCFLRACDEVGIRSEQHDPPTTTTSDELLAMVGSLNERDDVDGILAKMHTCLTLCSLFLRPQVDIVGLNLLNLASSGSCPADARLGLTTPVRWRARLKSASGEQI